MHTNRKAQFNLLLFLSLLIAILGSCDHQQKKQEKAKNASADDPLEILMHGNSHFAELKPEHPDEDLNRLKEVSKDQHPIAVIVSCSDSRVSPELIFDQGIGDLFVIRTAGNIIGNLELGSIEYAVEHLGVKLIVVLGHESCGAVQAYLKGGDAPGHIRDIVDSLKEESEIQNTALNDQNRLDKCVIANIIHGVNKIENQDGIVHEKILKKELQVIGARYDLENYKVQIVKQ
ncbi:MAG: carbonic anhydrase [Chitinophagaceae bacterium]|nr:carbonic anhydrase [Chitinophagaceae bacterium]